MGAAAIRFRRARRADAERLTRVAHAAKRYWRYPAPLMRGWRAALTVTPGFVARHPVWCALHGAVIVGFWAVSGHGRVRELEHFWIEPRHIRSGIGRALFAHLSGRLRAMRVRQLDIASDPHAEGFYRRLGAWRVGDVASMPPGRRLPLLRFRVPPRRG